MIRILSRAGFGVLLLAAAAGVAEAFTFDWPVPGKAVVTVDMLKRERAVRYKYVLTTERAAEGDAILVHSRNFEALVFDGQAIDTPQKQAAVAPLMTVAAAVPSLRIASDGSLAGFEGEFDEVFDRIASLVQGNPQAAKALETMRQTPQLREAAAIKVADIWATWVSNWIGLNMSDGETREDSIDVSAFGQTMAQATTVIHEGPSSVCPGCVAVRWEGVLDDPAFAEGWSTIMRSVAAQSGNTAGLEEFLSTIKSVSRVASIRLETDPETLMPYTVTRDNTILLQIGDGAPVRQVERTTYHFDWSAQPQ